jgi:ATP-binding cassette, subfamily G (WHITE), member 2, SNQ2
MLDVIGAGATASSKEDWFEIWKNTPEAMDVQKEIEKIHAEGRKRPPVETTLHSEFATSWFNQFILLLKRELLYRYRDATYLLAKLLLNILGGLFIGFTFFQADDSQQGTQNKLFVRDWSSDAVQYS